MIYTHTSNPSIDYYLELPGCHLIEGVQRAEHEFCLAGGKGLNVSMILNQLQVPSIATTFLGGFTGQFIEAELQDYSYIQLDTVSIEEMNRINVKIRGVEETDINTKGPQISKNDQTTMLNKFSQLTKNDWLLVCGSFAKNVDEQFLLDTAAIVHQQGAKLVLDVGCIDAKIISACKPYLIKPNIQELYAMFHVKENEVPVASLINQLQSTGVHNILLSMGSKGAQYYTQNHVFTISHPELPAVNTVGSGDSMLAGVVAFLDRGETIENALIWGAAAGEATAISKGLASIQKIEELKENVSISQE